MMACGEAAVGGQFGGDSDLKAAAANVDFSGAGAHAEHGGNLDELGPETLGGFDAPATTDVGSGLGLLRDDASGGDDGGIEVIAAGQLKTMLKGNALGLGGSHTTEVRHGDLTAMDGEPHADQGRGERDDDEHEHLGEQAEEADHARLRVDVYGVRGQGYMRFHGGAAETELVTEGRDVNHTTMIGRLIELMYQGVWLL